MRDSINSVGRLNRGPIKCKSLILLSFLISLTFVFTFFSCSSSVLALSIQSNTTNNSVVSRGLTEGVIVTNYNTSSATPSNHNALTGLQGGDIPLGQYYHLNLSTFNQVIATIYNVITGTTTPQYLSVSGGNVNFNETALNATIDSKIATVTNASANFVPYNGSTQNVNISPYNLSVANLILPANGIVNLDENNLSNMSYLIYNSTTHRVQLWANGVLQQDWGNSTTIYGKATFQADAFFQNLSGEGLFINTNVLVDGNLTADKIYAGNICYSNGTNCTYINSSLENLTLAILDLNSSLINYTDNKFVPYNGSTQSIDLGDNNLTLNRTIVFPERTGIIDLIQVNPGDGFKMQYHYNFEAINDDWIVFNKVDGNDPLPDGGIAFMMSNTSGWNKTILKLDGYDLANFTDYNILTTSNLTVHDINSTGSVHIEDSNTTIVTISSGVGNENATLDFQEAGAPRARIEYSGLEGVLKIWSLYSDGVYDVLMSFNVMTNQIIIPGNLNIGGNVTASNICYSNGTGCSNNTPLGTIGPYLYNNTTHYQFNETYLNTTVESLARVRSYQTNLTITTAGGVGSDTTSALIGFLISEIKVTPSALTSSYNFSAKTGAGATIDADRVTHTGVWDIEKNYAINDTVVVNITNSNPAIETYTININYVDNFRP